MPQFNWSVFGPLLLGVTAVVVGIAVLVTRLAPSPHQVAVAGAPPSQASTSRVLPTVVSTPRAVRLTGQAIGTPHLRAQPNSDAAVVNDLRSGEPVEVSACSHACAWYLVTPAGSTPGWVPAAFITLQGNDRVLPMLK